MLYALHLIFNPYLWAGLTALGVAVYQIDRRGLWAHVAALNVTPEQIRRANRKTQRDAATAAFDKMCREAAKLRRKPNPGIGDRIKLMGLEDDIDKKREECPWLRSRRCR